MTLISEWIVNNVSRYLQTRGIWLCTQSIIIVEFILHENCYLTSQHLVSDWFCGNDKLTFIPYYNTYIKSISDTINHSQYQTFHFQYFTNFLWISFEKNVYYHKGRFIAAMVLKSQNFSLMDFNLSSLIR